MEWITALRKSIDYIEAHLLENISAQDVAANVYLSPLYLQRGFQILTGMSMSEYIRNRRLYLAAMEIGSTEQKIIEIALKYGYDTPESFTKAFTRFHECSPMQLRRDHNPAKVFLPLQINITITGGTQMNYTVSPLPSFRLIGFERIFSFETGYAEIPKFWDQICEKHAMIVKMSGKAQTPLDQAIIDNCIGEYGLCIDDCNDGKHFRYMIAGKYTGGNVPEGMKIFEVPQFEWAKFKCVGPLPTALQCVNTQIFNEWLPNNPDYQIAAGINIEWYSYEGDKSAADYESGIWVPVIPKA